MLKVGITGGMGAGKSVVSKVLRCMGYSVYDADSRTKELYRSDEGLREELRMEFGDEIYDRCGNINKTRFAEIIFGDKERLRRANGIIHPAVTRDFRRYAELRKEEKVVFIESAILLECMLKEEVEMVITVSAGEEERIRRVMNRDKCGRGVVMERMRNQMSDEERRKCSDFEIRNEDGGEMVTEQVERVIERLQVK